MSPQLYTSMYQEQYSSPGAVQRTVLRPTSAHRRNNPQPRADFLFPVSLKSRQRPLQTDPGRTPLPPIGPPHTHSPVITHYNGTHTAHYNGTHTTHSNGTHTAERGTQLNMPPVTHLPPVSSGHKTTRSFSDSVLQGRPHTTFHRPRTLSSSALDHSGCCSCFHVVKPFHPGHYTIHPEFVSEYLH